MFSTLEFHEGKDIDEKLSQIKVKEKMEKNTTFKEYVEMTSISNEEPTHREVWIKHA